MWGYQTEFGGIIMRKIIVLVLAISVLAICLCGCGKEPQLDKYVSNADEVYTVVQDEFGYYNEKAKIYDGEQTQLRELDQTGNGYYFLTINGKGADVYCENHIAIWVRFSRGDKRMVVTTPSGQEYQNKQNTAVSNNVGEVIDGQ